MKSGVGELDATMESGDVGRVQCWCCGKVVVSVVSQERAGKRGAGADSLART